MPNPPRRNQFPICISLPGFVGESKGSRPFWGVPSLRHAIPAFRIIVPLQHLSCSQEHLARSLTNQNRELDPTNGWFPRKMGGFLEKWVVSSKNGWFPRKMGGAKMGGSLQKMCSLPRCVNNLGFPVGFPLKPPQKDTLYKIPGMLLDSKHARRSLACANSKQEHRDTKWHLFVLRKSVVSFWNALQRNQPLRRAPHNSDPDRHSL